MNKKIGLIIGVIVLLILIISFPFTVKLVQERQNLQKQAAVPGGSATFSLTAANTATIQQRIPVTVAVKAPGSPTGIIGITTALKITSSGSSPIVSVTADDIAKPLSPSFTYYEPTIDINGSTITIIIDSAWLQSGTGYLEALNSFQNFTVINLLATGTGTINIDFDMDNSFVSDKNRNLDVLNDQAGGKSITITSNVAPTATVTPTTGVNTTATPTSTTAPAETATTTATPTLTGRGGGTLPTNTPTPIRTATATPTPIASTTGQVKITSLASGQTVPTSKPTLSGTAVPSSTITITIHSDPITAIVTADASGRWTWTPTVDLAPGSHSVTISAVSPQGATTTTTSTFSVGSLPVTGDSSLTLILLALGSLILLPVFVISRKKASLA